MKEQMTKTTIEIIILVTPNPEQLTQVMGSKSDEILSASTSEKVMPKAMKKFTIAVGNNQKSIHFHHLFWRG
jgi:hypothetical protein